MTATAKASDPSKGFSIISEQKLLSLYAALLACRASIEASAAGPSRSRFSLVGREAAIVAAAIDLTANDVLAASWPHNLFRTINPAPNFHHGIPAAATLASRPPGALTLTFITHRQSSSSSFKKIVERAVSQKLPAMFVIVDADKSSSTLPSISFKLLETKAYTFPIITVDNSDPVALYRVVSESMGRARKGHGPSIIECLAVNDLDPVHVIEAYLARKGLLDGPRKTA